jgi:hypothetical protein
MYWLRAAAVIDEARIGGRESLRHTAVSVGTSIVPPGPCPPPADAPGTSSTITAPQARTPLHDFAVSLAILPERGGALSLLAHNK